MLIRFQLPRLSPLALPLILAPLTPAMANLPEPVQKMLDAAIADGSDAEIDAVARFAKATNPDAAAEIDQQIAAVRTKRAAAQKARLAAANWGDNWKGEGQVGGFRSTGNTSSFGLSAALKLSREALRWRVNLALAADLQRSNGETIKEQYGALIEPNYKCGERLFAYGLAQYEHDRFQGFSSRYSLSGGVGYRVIARPNATLDLKIGPALRITDFTAGGSDTTVAGRGSLDFDWTIAPNLKLTEDASAYIQSGNSTFVSTTALDTKLFGGLSTRMSYSLEYESDPPFGRLSTDTISRLTLVYGF